MPNLPVRIGKGLIALASDSADLAARALVSGLMATLGHAEWFEDDAGFELASELTGAGPAFLFRFIDALTAAAAEGLGLPYDQAARLALKMVEGAGALAAASDEDPRDPGPQGGEPRRHHRGGLEGARRRPRLVRPRPPNARSLAGARSGDGRRSPVRLTDRMVGPIRLLDDRQLHSGGRTAQDRPDARIPPV